jgi:flagellar biosynthetic protein FlhB
VVITNPTHLAVALRFDPAAMTAPRVTAKGADYVAERIRDIARESHVPIVENKPLAQALYKMADPGDTIPVDLYRAVAEVLAYVYRLKGRYAL